MAVEPHRDLATERREMLGRGALGAGLEQLALLRGRVPREHDLQCGEGARQLLLVILEPQQGRENALDLAVLAEHRGVDVGGHETAHRGIEQLLLDREMKGHRVGELGQNFAALRRGLRNRDASEQRRDLVVLGREKLEGIEGAGHGSPLCSAHATPRACRAMVAPMGRQRAGLVALGLVAAWWWSRDDAPAPVMHVRPTLQSAVLSDGFATLSTGAAPFISSLDGEGRERRRTPVAISGDTRILGTRAGVTLAYVRGAQLELATVRDDGTLRPLDRFGAKVVALCDGAVSTERRFGLAWRDADDGLWMLRGPAASAASIAETATWCAVRSAGAYTSLLWREGVTIKALACSDRACSEFITPMKIARGATLADVACQAGGCVLATWTAPGTLTLTAYDLRGKRQWTQDRQVKRTRVQLVAAGPDAYALVAAREDHVAVERVLARTGSTQTAWIGTPDSVPVITWARDQLLLAYRTGGPDGLAHELLAFPR